jgi:glycosidase
VARCGIFSYALWVPPQLEKLSYRAYSAKLATAILLCTFFGSAGIAAPGQAAATENTSVVTKVEPPNWWVDLTPEVMVLLSGRDLQATRVTCNLSTITVQRTQSSADGKYLFVWLTIGKLTRPGTAVCRITTSTGGTSFELPLSAKTSSLGKFQGLSQDDVLYLIMPDRFANGDPSNDDPKDSPNIFDRAKPRAYHGGDFAGVREHLDYLKELGVTTLWLTPVVKNSGAQSYHGYGATDLYAVDPHLGALKDYQDLVAEAHRRHMKIFFDIVPNHIGPRHPWVTNPPTPDWFHGTLQNHLNTSAPLAGLFYGKSDGQPGNDPFEVLVDPHAPASLSRNLTTGWFAGILPDMNTENPLVAQYLLQNSIWWTQTSGLDGLRIDTFPYVSRQFWAGWHAGLRRIYPYLTTIGEVFHPDPGVTSFFVGGQKRFDGIDSGLTTVFDFPLYFVMRDVLLKNASVEHLADVLRHDSLYSHPNGLVTFFANHDVTRFSSADGSSPAKLKLAFGLALTLRGIPQLYYGDEIGLPGGGDPDNRRDFPGGWREDAKNAFVPAGRSTQQQEIFAYVQSLLRLRREHPALSSGYLWDLESDDSSFVFVRIMDEERILVAFNNSTQARELLVPVSDTPVQNVVDLSVLSGNATAVRTGHDIKINIPSQSISIFTLN